MKILLVALIILILAQAAQAGDWPIYRHDAAHTGTADEVVELPLELLWKYTTGGQVSSPAVSGGAVYVNSGGNLYALYAATGAPKWENTTGSSRSSPAVSGEVIYAIGEMDKWIEEQCLYFC